MQWDDRPQAGTGVGWGLAFARFKNLSSYLGIVMQLQVDAETNTIDLGSRVTGVHTGFSVVYPAFCPVLWMIERLISTPATHSAHHGKHMDDGVTHYKGNYGNLLFFWDVLFGTDHITRRYPEEISVENLEPVTASRQLLWPFVRDNNRKELQ